jgi:hypothetical protein
VYARRIQIGSDYFIDFAVQRVQIEAPDTVQLVFGANSNRSTGFVTGYSGDIAGVGNLPVSTWGSVASDMITLTSAVPEPETYAMLLAGLALLGFAARRKQRVSPPSPTPAQLFRRNICSILVPVKPV